MPERISAALGITHEAFEAAGVFDRFIDIDSRLHVDPHLLSHSTAPELVAATRTLDRYWEDTISVLRGVFDYGDRFWRESLKRFTFPENPSVGLGYAAAGTSGAAIGRKTAEGLVDTARQLVRAGIVDPKVFELVGLFEPNVGPDLISDMTVHIVESHLLEFTQRICADLRIPTKTFFLGGANYQLPACPSTERHLILLPADILRDLPVAYCWEDIDTVCAYNHALRARLNSLIGENWKRATADNKKQKLKQVLLENPEALTDLIQQYRSKPAEPYDFARDILGETIWLDVAKNAAVEHPLDLKTIGPATAENILHLVRAICGHFRHLVEDCGLSRIFWTDDNKLRHERLPQLLFFSVADCYCKANNIDLSPEVNSGRGPVDFKLSQGYAARVLVEIKWSKNTKLVHGFETQLEEYGKAEQTETSMLLVIRVTESEASIKRIQAIQTEAIRQGKRTPEISIIDGRMKDSASHFSE
jgi:hypothetical protein